MVMVVAVTIAVVIIVIFVMSIGVAPASEKCAEAWSKAPDLHVSSICEARSTANLFFRVSLDHDGLCIFAL
jgi:hypothetical protein